MAEEARRGRACRQRDRLAGAAATKKQGGVVLGEVLVCEGDSRRTASWQQQGGGRERSATAALMQEDGPHFSSTRLAWRLAARGCGGRGLGEKKWEGLLWATLAAAAARGVRRRREGIEICFAV
jgi:hypothetical protein